MQYQTNYSFLWNRVISTIRYRISFGINPALTTLWTVRLNNLYDLNCDSRLSVCRNPEELDHRTMFIHENAFKFVQFPKREIVGRIWELPFGFNDVQFQMMLHKIATQKQSHNIHDTLKTQQIVVFSGCIGNFCMACGCLSLQMRQLCLFAYPFRLKWTSSLNTIFR